MGQHGEHRGLVAALPGNARLLAATILGSSLAFIDGSVVNVALPAIQADLRADAAAMQWVVDAYLLLLGALVMLGGALGDRLGRVRVFMAGIVLFTAASLACGLAPGAASLIAARGVQGLGAALVVPGSLAIIGAAIPADRRAAAIGTWPGAGALTTALGPVLGGWLVDAVSWRAVFLINLPLATATLWLARGIPDSQGAGAAGPLDWPGAMLAAGGWAWSRSASSPRRARAKASLFWRAWRAAPCFSPHSLWPRRGTPRRWCRSACSAPASSAARTG